MVPAFTSVEDSSTEKVASFRFAAGRLSSRDVAMPVQRPVSATPIWQKCLPRICHFPPLFTALWLPKSFYWIPLRSVR